MNGIGKQFFQALVMLAIVSSAQVLAQDPALTDEARQEAIKRVQETMRQVQSMQGDASVAPSGETQESAQPLLVEDVVPASTETSVEEAAVAAEAVSKDSRNPMPFFPSQSKKNIKPNTVSTGVSKEAKKNFYQSAMTVSPLGFRDMMAIMATKKRVVDGVSYDDAVEAMLFRANEVNFKNVGVNKLWLDVRAITGDENTPRVEIYQFCDAMVARSILDYSPEFAIFLPCRVALIEDGDGVLWVMTMDWDVTWLDYTQNPNNKLDNELRENAIRIRNALDYIMEGAASGDF